MGLRRKAAFTVAALLLVISAVITMRALTGSAENADWIAQKQASYNQLRRLLSAMRDAETGQRGYFVTQNPVFLDPYTAGLAQSRLLLANCEEAFRSSYPDQIRALSVAIREESDYLREAVRLTTAGQNAAVVQSSARGKTAMDHVRAVIKDLSDRESARLLEHRARLTSIIHEAMTMVSVSLTLALLVAGGAVTNVLHDLRNRAATEDALRKAREELELRVEERTRELGRSNGQLRATNRALQEESERGLQLQHELRGSNLRFESVFKNAPIGIAQTTIDGRFVLVNPGLCELTGYTESELLSKNVQQITHVDDAAESQELATKLWSGEINSYSLRKRYVHASGSAVWVSLTVSLLRDDAGIPRYGIGVVQDIAKELAAEQGMLESEGRYRFLADTVPQIVWTARPDGQVDYYNQRWFDYTGLTFEQTRGQGWKAVEHPEDLPRCVELWNRCVETGDPFEMEVRFKRASDGEYRWHLSRAFPLTDQSGNVRKWFGTCTDIEDFKRAENEIRALNKALEQRVLEHTEALGTSEISFQSLIKSVKDYAIIMLDPLGRVSTWNEGAESITGYTEQEILGKEFACFYTEEDRNAGHPAEGLSCAIETGQFTGEGWRVSKGGSQFWASVSITKICNPDGSLRGFSKITRDISDSKRSEELLLKNSIELAAANASLSIETKRAEEANRAKSDFLAAMSHEIRTPMNAILGMADLLWESDLNTEQRRFVEVFRRAGNNLLTLINDILDFSKIESGHFELEQISFDLQDLFDRTVELVEPKARAKGLELSATLSPKLHTSLIGDPMRLQQVFLNLLGNAVKFTEKGRISLFAEPAGLEDGRISISVSDTGTGIPREKLATIFDDFTQADSSITRKFGGTGLGLAICKRLVARMGGELVVTSELGKGSTFAFTGHFEPAPQSARAVSRASEDFHGKRVLIVDDDEINRLIICRTLHSWGLTTSDFENAKRGIDELAAAMVTGNPYSLVLLDSRMAGVDGFETSEQIKDLAPEIPLIILTSESHPGDATRCEPNGIVGYAVKPVKRADLLRLICIALGTGPDKVAGKKLPSICEEEAGHSSTLRLLVAEDSRDNQILLEAYLGGGTYEITFAENGETAVEQFAAGTYDLVLMDMQMPVMDGLTATQRIRAFEKENGRTATPIISLTANALQRDIDAALRAGCNAQLSKPISKQRLVSAIGDNLRPAELTGGAMSPDHDVPPGLEEHAKKYIDGRRLELPILQRFRSDSNFDEIRTLAHNMKGTGTSFGFPELTRLGNEIELSAKREDAGAIDRQLLELSSYLLKAHEFCERLG